MKVNVRTTIILPGMSKHFASAIISALEPDNTKAPRNIYIENVVGEDSLRIVIVFQGESKELLSLRNTIDDLLEHLNMTLRVLESVKDN